MKRLETIANISVIIAAVVLVAFLGRQEWQRRHPASSVNARALEGRTVQLPSVRFGSQKKTLLIAISTTCHFCRDSEAFYKELAAQSQNDVQLVAVLPQAQNEAEQYVHQAIAPNLQVVSASLDSLGVTGTPTLLLVDGGGKVQKAWIGKLDGPGQQQVRSLL